MADFSHAQIERTVFDRADLTMANFHAADLMKASTAGARLTSIRTTDQALLRAETFRTPADARKG